MYLLINIVSWLLIWLLAWAGFFLYLAPKGVDYIKTPKTAAVYFLTWSVAVILIFFDYFQKLTANFSLSSLLVPALVLIITPFIYTEVKKRLPRPSQLIAKHKLEYFLRLDNKYLLSKFFELIFQQAMIILLIYLLAEIGLHLSSLTGIFFVFFFLVHLPLIKLTDKFFALVFIFSSLAAAFLFPFLILKVNSGFVYAYTLHWLYYVGLGVFFWFKETRT